MEVPQKLSIELLPSDPATPLLDIFSITLKAETQRDVCSPCPWHHYKQPKSRSNPSVRQQRNGETRRSIDIPPWNIIQPLKSNKTLIYA